MRVGAAVPVGLEGRIATWRSRPTPGSPSCHRHSCTPSARLVRDAGDELGLCFRRRRPSGRPRRLRWRRIFFARLPPLVGGRTWLSCVWIRGSASVDQVDSGAGARRGAASGADSGAGARRGAASGAVRPWFSMSQDCRTCVVLRVEGLLGSSGAILDRRVRGAGSSADSQALVAAVHEATRLDPSVRSCVRQKKKIAESFSCLRSRLCLAS